jgi:hypothetical protein
MMSRKGRKEKRVATTEKTEKSVESDPRFKFGPPPIQTPEDATMAYLRGDISEDELRAAHAKFGVVPGSIQRVGNAERLDAAYENQLPEDLFSTPKNPEDNIKSRLERADEKQKERDEATKTAEKTEKKNMPVAELASTSSSSSKS